MTNRPTAADYVARLHRASHDCHIGAMTYDAHSAFNRSLWSEIEQRPRLKSIVLRMLRTFGVPVVLS